jgi:hypothetical protein
VRARVFRDAAGWWVRIGALLSGPYENLVAAHTRAFWMVRVMNDPDARFVTFDPARLR